MKRALSVLSLLAVFTLGLAAVGCGGDDNAGNGSGASDEPATVEADRAKIRELASKIKLYMKNGNAEGFCGLFESGQLEDWVGQDRCVAFFSEALKQAPKNSDVNVKNIQVDGDTASLNLGFGATNLQKIDGQWYLETPETDPPEASSSQE